MKYVIYYRVSTKSQGESGLGLAAQERDVNLFLSTYSDQPFEILETITDVKSGKGLLSDRPQLQAAINLAKKHNATLLVAKLDRLSRDVETIAHIIKRTEIKIACMPNADSFQIHIYAALAQQERDFISTRTKAALAETKAKGTKLGSQRPDIAAMNKGKKDAALERAEKYRYEFTEMKNNGYTMRKMVESLNARNVKTSAGGEWSLTQVSRTLKRLSI